MSVSVDIPGHGHFDRFDILLTASSTAADIIFLLRERLPGRPWHGNKLLSSGVCQLQCDDVVEATRHSSLVLTNYSEITNQETNLDPCFPFFEANMQIFLHRTPQHVPTNTMVDRFIFTVWDLDTGFSRFQHILDTGGLRDLSMMLKYEWKELPLNMRFIDRKGRSNLLISIAFQRFEINKFPI